MTTSISVPYLRRWRSVVQVLVVWTMTMMESLAPARAFSLMTDYQTICPIRQQLTARRPNNRSRLLFPSSVRRTATTPCRLVPPQRWGSWTTASNKLPLTTHQPLYFTKPQQPLPSSTPPSSSGVSFRANSASTALLMTEQDATQSPTTFREAEILGLKLMQEGEFEPALKAFEEGLQLPGSRPDVLRTKTLPVSPVGGGMGGLETRAVQTLDEFELQAAHYNMACAHAQLGNLDQALTCLETAIMNGFDNFATVRADPDLDPIKSLDGFSQLLDKYEPKKGRGFNPFGFFNGNSNNSGKSNKK